MSSDMRVTLSVKRYLFSKWLNNNENHSPLCNYFINKFVKNIHFMTLRAKRDNDEIRKLHDNTVYYNVSISLLSNICNISNNTI